MIIQVAGTNGSGKSTVVRTVMEKFGPCEAREDKGCVVGYTLGEDAMVGVVGPYAAPTGGCDAMDPGEAFRRIAEAAELCGHVLFEGIFVMNQTSSPALLAKLGLPWVVLLLDTPLATCQRSIDHRRRLRGEGRPLGNLRNIQSNYGRARNYTARMRDAGASVRRISRDDAPGEIIRLLLSE